MAGKRRRDAASRHERRMVSRSDRETSVHARAMESPPLHRDGRGQEPRSDAVLEEISWHARAMASRRCDLDAEETSRLAREL